MKHLFSNDFNDKLRIFLFAALWMIWTDNSQAQPRVIVVGGSLTEIIYELGAEASIVGVDTTSRWPARARKFPQVGYQRNLAAEGILSLRPDIIFATAAAGPPEVLEQIRSAHVSIHSFPEDFTLAGIEHRINDISKVLGHEEAGRNLITGIRQKMVEARLSIPKDSARPKVLFLLGVGKGAPLASGRDTAAHAMIELAGGDNVFKQIEGYKPVSAEAIIAAAPDYLLIVDHRANGDVAALKSRYMSALGISMTPAGKNNALIVKNGARLLGFGPRMPEALAELAKQLHKMEIITAGNTAQVEK